MKKKITIIFGVIVLFGVLPMLSLTGGSFFIDDSTGYVGLGNVNPASRLDVAGAIYTRLKTYSDASSVTIDWNQGNVHTITLNTSITTFTFSNGQAGGKYDLILNPNATGNQAVEWPASVEWWDGSTPLLPTTGSSTSVVSFIFDGSNYLGHVDYRSSPPEPIAFDATAQVGNITASNQKTWTHPGCTSCSNMVVVVALADMQGDHVTGVTYGGTAMLQVEKANRGDGRFNYLYLLSNAPTGSQTVSVSLSASDNLSGISASYIHAAPTGQLDVANAATGTASPDSVSVNTSTNDVWLVGTADSEHGVSSGTGTQRGTGDNDATIWDSNGPKNPAGS